MPRRVRGVTTELATNRSWELDGELDQSGFLRASYRAAGAEDGGAKTLLLAIDGDGGGLRGLWASCDSTDREVASGQYLIRRCPEAEG